MELVERRTASTELMVKDILIDSIWGSFDEVLRRAECIKGGDREIITAKDKKGHLRPPRRTSQQI